MSFKANYRDDKRDRRPMLASLKATAFGRTPRGLKIRRRPEANHTLRAANSLLQLVTPQAAWFNSIYAGWQSKPDGGLDVCLVKKNSCWRPVNSRCDFFIQISFKSGNKILDDPCIAKRLAPVADEYVIRIVHCLTPFGRHPVISGGEVFPAKARSVEHNIGLFASCIPAKAIPFGLTIPDCSPSPSPHPDRPARP